MTSPSPQLFVMPGLVPQRIAISGGYMISGWGDLFVIFNPCRLESISLRFHQNLPLTERVLAEGAMSICERDHTIHLLQHVATGLCEQDFRHSNQAHHAPTQTTSSQPNLILPTPIKLNSSQSLLQCVINSIGTT